jgi:RNA polymerase primary sigma factor
MMKIDTERTHLSTELSHMENELETEFDEDSSFELSDESIPASNHSRDDAGERSAGTSSIRSYLREMGRHSLLGKVEEIELSKQIEQGRKAILKGIAMTRHGSQALADQINIALTGEISADKIIFSGPNGNSQEDNSLLKQLHEVHGELRKLGKPSAVRSERIRDRRAEGVSESLSDLRFDPNKVEEIGESILNLRNEAKDSLLPKAKRAIRSGWQELDEARNKMVEGNLRLVISVARRYRNHGLDMLDLIQEGNLGLMKAVDRFDHRKGCKFSTYAVWWIRQTIRRAITTHVRPVRLPANVVELLTKMRAANDQLRQSLKREPFDDELAENLDLRPDQITTLRKVMQSHVSMEAPLGDDGETMVGHLIPDDRTEMAWEEVNIQMLYDRLDDLLRTLPEREEVILRLRYGIGGDRIYTLDEVAERFGVTRERIRQLEVRALRKMRHPRRSAGIKTFLN